MPFGQMPRNARPDLRMAQRQRMGGQSLDVPVHQSILESSVQRGGQVMRGKPGHVAHLGFPVNQGRGAVAIDTDQVGDGVRALRRHLEHYIMYQVASQRANLG
jgi:hypothetical protein